MQAEKERMNPALEQLARDLEEEDRKALLRAKVGIGIQAALVILVAAYMIWLSGMLGRLDAREITGLAAATVEERLPEIRKNVRDHAIQAAPHLTDEMVRIVLNVPSMLRENLEGQLLSPIEELITRLETDLDTILTTVLEDQFELLKAEFAGGTAEHQLDGLILGISDIFRQTMSTALDEMYADYSGEVYNLNRHLQRLLKGEDLTKAEILDRKLIGAWMVIVRGHEITSLEPLMEQFRVGS